VRQVDLKVSSFPLAGDLERSVAAAVVADADHLLPQAEPAPRPFRLGVAALNALLGGTAPPPWSPTQLWILTLSGLMPPLEDCAEIADDLEFLVACRTLAPSELPRLPSADSCGGSTGRSDARPTGRSARSTSSARAGPDAIGDDPRCRRRGGHRVR
jgi:hypothetical protein